MKIQNYQFLNQEPDLSGPFQTLGNIHYNVQNLGRFDPASGKGILRFKRFERKGRIGFNMYSTPFEPTISWTFPPVYPDEPEYPFLVEQISPNTLRVRICYDAAMAEMPETDSDSLMLCDPLPKAKLTPVCNDDSHVLYQTDRMRVEIRYDPFHIIVRDAKGVELTKTLHTADSFCLQNCNPLPLSYVQSAGDIRKYPAMSFSIRPGEHFYGTGESFGTLDKLGQKINLWTKDANGCETDDMYKPVPFFISSRGYGIFYHTTAPLTMDFGREYKEAQTVYMGDGNVDLFLFTGTPKEILNAYTDLTGKSPLPPLWSFGLWMSRITYKSEEETREVAKKLQEHRIPCDVIHLDTGWFEEDWLCNYRFSPSRFQDPKLMISDLKQMGYRVSLWQIPYFTPRNEYFRELVDRALSVGSPDQSLPTDDAILDFSNPETVRWYQEKLKNLFDMGIAAIKADFGEAAPLTGTYHSGKSGLMEHNLYPLRYNKAVFDITKEHTGEGIIWARSAWAGSQRYPLHWGGDSENTNMGMLSSLRGGLSLGACGFSFWSHDLGGFVRQSPEELYTRWTFMGVFTSHMRCHGAPPKEPWAYSDSFLKEFRRLLELRYQLMPYILAQSIHCTEKGLPLMRAMFIEHPEDPSCNGLEDQYFFGNDILVAPLFEEERTRLVYLPEGNWVELGTNQVLAGGKWRRLTAEAYPGLAFVRAGAVIPTVPVALTTDAIDWSQMRHIHFSDGSKKTFGLYPNDSLQAVCSYGPECGVTFWPKEDF